MAVKFKVNKEKCISCGVCISVCPGGADWGKDGKSEIIDSEKMMECGGETVCPYGAIEKVKEKE
jgi:ferredoxin